ncbi:MAG: hypothetical protein J5953_05340 [Prevotella sp.]|nr:hypothetical protein [Prevotella sp.]
METNRKKLQTASEAIEALLKEIGLNAPTFAKEIGLNYQRIYDIQSGRVKKINEAVARKIRERYPRVNPNFLFTYEFPITLEPGQSPKPQTENVRDMVDQAVERLMNTDEYKERVNNVAEREAKVLAREERMSELQETVSKQMTDISEREKLLRAKEEQLLHLEHSIMNREMNILQREQQLEKELLKKGLQEPSI